MNHALFQILALLRSEPGDVVTLLERIEATGAGPAPSLPAFYRHLRAGLDRGWIRISGTDGTDEGPGRPRQVYALTDAGRDAAREWACRLERLTALVLERPRET